MSTDQLKKVVADKTAKCEYDVNAVRELLRHYQTADPTAFDWSLVANTLLLARTFQLVHNNDFSLLCCLVGDQYHSTPEMRWLLAIDDIMATGKFDKLWAHLEECTTSGDIAGSLKEFYTKNKVAINQLFVRSILLSVSVATVEVEASVILAFTNAKSTSELAASPAAKGIVEKATDKSIVFVKNDANTPPAAAAPRTLITSDVAALAKTIA